MEEFTKYYRYDLDISTHNKLQLIIEDAIQNKDYNLSEEIINKLTNPKEIKDSINKRIAISQARQAKSEQLKKKVLDAIEYLIRRKMKINYSQIAKIAEVNRATAKKYTPNYYIE